MFRVVGYSAGDISSTKFPYMALKPDGVSGKPDRRKDYIKTQFTIG
jgi:hypothetical protein